MGQSLSGGKGSAEIGKLFRGGSLIYGAAFSWIALQHTLALLSAYLFLIKGKFDPVLKRAQVIEKLRFVLSGIVY